MNQSLSFNEKCYALLKKIHIGKVTTYKDMARAMGTNAWRAVGTAMAKNTHLVTIPCHRVVRSDGVIGYYALGTEKKGELLNNEGVDISNGKINKLDKFFYKFSA